MSTDLPKVFESALSLPDSQRAELAFQLLGSLKPPGVMHESDSELAQEIERRLIAHDSGETQTSSLDAVDQRVREALRDRHSP